MTEIILGIAALILGVSIGLAYSGRARVVAQAVPSPEPMVRLYTLFYRLTLLGYALWVLFAFLRGLDLSTILAAATLQPGAISSLKSLSAPVGGVTTITQFGPPAIALSLILRRRYGTRVRVAPLIILATGRAFFYAERLALLEIAIAGVVTLVLLHESARLGARAKRVFLAAPILAVASLWTTFALFEYSRSWVTYRDVTSSPYAVWITDRLLSYYATSYNNSALLAAHLENSSAAPYFSAVGFWEFPGVKSLLGSPLIARITPAEWWATVLAQDANPEFTSTGSFLVAMAELGVFGAICYWLTLGLLLGALYSRARNGYAWAIVGYAVTFVGLLELPRFIYFVEGRFFPMVIAVALIAHFESKERRQ